MDIPTIGVIAALAPQNPDIAGTAIIGFHRQPLPWERSLAEPLQASRPPEQNDTIRMWRGVMKNTAPIALPTIRSSLIMVRVARAGRPTGDVARVGRMRSMIRWKGTA